MKINESQTDWKPQEGHKVLVSNDNIRFVPRIFLHTFKGRIQPHSVVAEKDEHNYLRGKDYAVEPWGYISSIINDPSLVQIAKSATKDEWMRIWEHAQKPDPINADEK